MLQLFAKDHTFQKLQMDPPDKQNLDITPDIHSNYVLRTQQLPETDMASSENLCKFFKVKTRINQDFMNVQIGLLVLQYQHFQEDFITYLANMLMCQVQFLNVFIVDPMHLYISMNAASQRSYTTNYDYLQLESDIYFLLEFCQKTLLQFFQNYVSEYAIFGQNETNSEQILKQFQKNCIKLITDMHQKVFNKKNI